MRLSGFLFAAVASLSLDPVAQARIVTTTITGTVAGSDGSGVFGPANTSLNGQPFTLVFKFDDTVGRVCCASTDATGTSSIYYTSTQSPGTATLSIGTGKYVFGTAVSPGPTYYGATSYATSDHGKYLQYQVNDSLPGGRYDAVMGYVYPAAGSTFPIASWEGYFSSTSLGTPPSGQELTFTIGYGQTYGTLTPTSIAQPAPVLNLQPPSLASMAILPSGASANGASLMAAVGDYDGDGHQDIATTNVLDSSVSLLYGKGDGTFQSAATFATGRGPYGIATAASASLFEPYGTLYVANGLDNTLTVLRYSGASLNQTTTYPVGSEPFGISVNNGIGAVANTASNSISVWPTGHGQLPDTYPAGNTPFGTTFADFNHDSYPDLAVWNYGDDTVGIYPNNGLTAPNGAF